MAYEIYVGRDKQWHWRLRAANNLIIAMSSEGYERKTDCRHAVDLVKSAWSAPVYDV